MTKLDPKLKVTIRAALFCLSLLLFGGYLLTRVDAQKDDPIAALLKLPAPPPPNPLVKPAKRGPANASIPKGTPPADDASIEELLDFWSEQQRLVRNPRYTPPMSDRTFERLSDEIEKNPSLLTGLMGALPEGPRSAEFVKNLFDREGENGAFDRDARAGIKTWLTYHSSYFSDELARRARKAGDNESYVDNQEDLLQLARHDFEKARPMIERLAANIGKPSYALAKWAQYRHALDTDSAADIERYREELKALVADSKLSAPMRDLAMDALVTERAWPERDDWYMSLLSDESLADLGGYTGLTTIINVSPPQMYTAKMLERLKTETNQTARAAIIRNLALQLNSENIEIVRALLPWLDDPNWAKDHGGSRSALLEALATLEVPESVPGLIKMLDEKVKGPHHGMNAAFAANTVRTTNTNSANVSTGPGMEVEMESTFYRNAAIAALAKQADPRAVPALRRVLGEVEGYQRTQVITALVASKAFSISEQVDALEESVRNRGNAEVRIANVASMAANAAVAAGRPGARKAEEDAFQEMEDEYESEDEEVIDPRSYYRDHLPLGLRPGPMTEDDIRSLLGSILMIQGAADDELATAVVDRIEMHDTRDPQLARGLRMVVLMWENSAVNLLLLRDVKRDKAEVNSIMRLLATRSQIREDHSTALSDTLTGSPTAIGIGACLAEEPHAYESILERQNTAAKLALIACARLIRAPLPLNKVIDMARSGEKTLANAAQLYLESEDSIASRAVVLGLHPGEAYITGATTAFYPPGAVAHGELPFLSLLFHSVNEQTFFGYGDVGQDRKLMSIEKRLQNEVLTDPKVLKIYTYDRNYLRVYKDEIVFSWDEDDSRYRERRISKEEFERLTAYLAENRADEMTPFFQCSEYCSPKELLILSRSEGRRVYLVGESVPFFTGLDKYFDDLKTASARVKYALGREIPGLEMVLADDELDVKAVWKNGKDLRVAVSDRAVRQRVEDEIRLAAGIADESADPVEDLEDVDISTGQKLLAEETEKRRYEGFSWRAVIDGAVAGLVPQPAGVDLIPVRDSTTLRYSSADGWKARAGRFEMRASEDGLFKVADGKAVKLSDGVYNSLVITPNGKWLIAFRNDDENFGLVRRNLVTGKEFSVGSDEYRNFTPVAYIPSINKILVRLITDHHDDGTYPGEIDVPVDPRRSTLSLLDAETGALKPVKGEMRPFTHQTFRPLQPATSPGKFWAAIPNRGDHSTFVGLLDGSTFAFKTVLRLPKIAVNSMAVWVDEIGGKVYFVYKGHLLAVPLPKESETRKSR